MDERKKKIIEEPLRYKLNVFGPNGGLRAGIPTSVYHDMCVRYGDIMRAISSTRWMTMDEVCDAVWEIEKKMKYPSNRTRKLIEMAVAELMERTMVISR
jgi:hypothetical protein